MSDSDILDLNDEPKRVHDSHRVYILDHIFDISSAVVNPDPSDKQEDLFSFMSAYDSCR